MIYRARGLAKLTIRRLVTKMVAQSAGQIDELLPHRWQPRPDCSRSHFTSLGLPLIPWLQGDIGSHRATRARLPNCRPMDLLRVLPPDDGYRQRRINAPDKTDAEETMRRPLSESLKVRNRTETTQGRVNARALRKWPTCSWMTDAPTSPIQYARGISDGAQTPPPSSSRRKAADDRASQHPKYQARRHEGALQRASKERTLRIASQQVDQGCESNLHVCFRFGVRHL